MPHGEVVWLTEKRKYAWLVSMGAYFSVVQYTEDGIDYQEVVPTDEIQIWSERAIDYERDD